MPVMLKIAFPVFVKVTDCTALVVPTGRLPKATLEGEILTADAVPVPERPTECGLPSALSAMARDAVRVPLAAGLKTMLIEQVAPAATLTPQLFVWEKSLALAPETEMPETVKAAFPELVRATVWAVLGALSD